MVLPKSQRARHLPQRPCRQPNASQMLRQGQKLQRMFERLTFAFFLDFHSQACVSEMVWDLKKVKEKVSGVVSEDPPVEQKVAQETGEKKAGWLSRAASKVSSAATTISTKTASLLDFHSGDYCNPVTHFQAHFQAQFLNKVQKVSICMQHACLVDSDQWQHSRVCATPPVHGKCEKEL
jgi:hypothetical protein